MFSELEMNNFEYFYRTRLSLNIKTSTSSINHLVLNEVFAAEINPGKTSIYSFDIDGRDLGKFKSSGIIISSGTGSSGWLVSAKRVT